jgi:hypothetical protein
MELNAVPGMNTQIRSDEQSMLPWSPKDVTLRPSFKWSPILPHHFSGNALSLFRLLTPLLSYWMHRPLRNARIGTTKSEQLVTLHLGRVCDQIPSSSRVHTDNMTTVIVRQQLPESHLKQRPPLSCQSSRRRPSLRVTIPGTECFWHWLNGRLCDSPLVCFISRTSLYICSLISLSVGD